jgi:hypothetical protein
VDNRFRLSVNPALKKKRMERLRRTVPTVICLGISWYLWHGFASANGERLLAADFSLLSVVLLFRALKGLEGAVWEKPVAEGEEKKPRRLAFRIWCTVLCGGGFLVGTWMTRSSRPLPLPDWVVQEILRPISE